MSALFHINFRRESYLREVARARGRVIALGVWVAYFGVMGIVLGLYGLNCASLAQRVARLERQASRARVQAGQHTDWKVTPGQLTEIEHYVTSTSDWRERLARLSAALPINARLRSLALNPDNLSGPGDQNRLVIDGQLKLSPGENGVNGAERIASALRKDPIFASGFRTIRLASTRTSEESGPVAEFVIECQ
jgi:hypothetical protein